MSDGQMIDETDLSIATPKSQESESKLTMMAAMERNTIIQILRQTQGNKVETAKRLGIGRQTLYNKIKQYDIKV
jgi:DNA-binding NtrC family response regulator